MGAEDAENFSEENYPHSELSRRVIGAAITVHRELRPGLDEKLYEKALVLELHARGLAVDQQRQFPVFYRQTQIGILVPDLIVEGVLIVDPKVVTAFNEHHLAQMMGYLTITGLDLALLLNFKFARMQIRRVVRVV